METDQELFQKKFRTDSMRLQGWDYSSAAMYFITICTQVKEWRFGEVVKGKMVLSQVGRVVADEWVKTGGIRKNVTLDEWIIMPDHFHAIIGVSDHDPVETPQRGVSTGLKPGSLGAIIGQFKGAVTKRVMQSGNNDFSWQSGYYDHIIRNEADLERIREYIVLNPERWEKNRE